MNFSIQAINRRARSAIRGAAAVFFPETEQGDQIGVFDVPANMSAERKPAVMLMVGLQTASLTPSEARSLAFTLLHHAKQVDPGNNA